MLRIYGSITIALFISFALAISTAGVIGTGLPSEIMIYSVATGAMPDTRITDLYLSDVNRRLTVFWRHSERFASINIIPNADGKLVIQGCTFTGVCDLYLWDDGAEIRITDTSDRRESFITWGPDGRLAYWSCPDYTACDLQVWDGQVTQNLAHTGEIEGNSINITVPAWSSNGKLAFSVCNLELGNCEILIWDGETLQNLTHTPDRSEFGQVWSSDGRLAFSSCSIDYVNCNMRVWNGSEVEAVTDDFQGADVGAAWSVDNVLAFATCSVQLICDVVLWNGDSLENITNAPATSEFSPSWISENRLTYIANCQSLLIWDHGDVAATPLQRPCPTGMGLWSMSQLLIYAECDSSYLLCDLMVWDGEQSQNLSNTPLASERPLAWLP